MTAYVAHDTLVFVWNYLREHQSATRLGALKVLAKERKVEVSTELRNLKIALGLDPIVGGCGYISDADRMLRDLIMADSEKKMLEMLIALRRQHPKAANF